MMKKIIFVFCACVFAANVSASGIFDVFRANNNGSGVTEAYASDNKKNAISSSDEMNERADENVEKFESVYKELLENYVDVLDPDVLYKGAMEGMFNTLNDPYSEYYEKASSQGISLQDTLVGSFGGVGVTIQKPAKSTEEKPAYVEVMSAIDGTPGAKAGLQPGDYITEIEGTPTDEITMEDVLKKLRGQVGTKVTIKVLRGKNMTFNLTITRARIEVPTVKYTMFDNQIGYIKLLEFNPNSTPKIREAYNALEKQGCKKIIFDLRNNGGGLLDAAVSSASFFISSGVVVSTDGRMKNSVVTFNVDRFAYHLPSSVPVVTLINSGSASASEILAGALKDNKRSILVGTTSYGKGVVQMVWDLNDKEAFKFTTARYYTPSGANIHKRGIPADYEVAFPEPIESEVEEFARLYDKGQTVLDNFARSKENISTAEIKAFAKKLQAEYKIRLELLELAVNNRVNNYQSGLHLNTEFDPQLKKAVELLRTTDVNALAAKAKTVAELQEMQEAKKDKAGK